MTRGSPPEHNEVEVSVLGPGTGEAVILHMGNDDWVVVDCCRHRDTEENAVVEYLGLLGIDTTRVRLLVASHAHDDHINGFAALVETFGSAIVACSAATTAEEFFALLEQDQHLGPLRHSVYTEFNRIFDVMLQRQTGAPAYTYTWAFEGRELWSRPEVDDVPAATVWALSPSDLAVTRSKQAFASLAAAAGQTPTVPQRDPNELAVAVWAQVGSAQILLGSDLTRGPNGCGWMRVVSGSVAKGEHASVFKIAHQGDPKADYPLIWSELLTPDPVAVVAPYRPSRRPRPDDVERLCRRTENTFLTANPGWRISAGSARIAAASLAHLAMNVRETDRHAGHVRLRLKYDAFGPWNVELFPPAQGACRDRGAIPVPFLSAWRETPAVVPHPSRARPDPVDSDDHANDVDATRP